MIQYDKNKKLALLEEVEFTKHFQENQWAAYNRRFFNGLAQKYDALNEVLSMGQQKRFKRKAIARLNIRSSSKILDVCTGSGDMAILMAKTYPNSHITAIDFSENMLQIAKAKAQQAKCENIQFVQGDAMNMPFDDNSFDAIFVGFGLRNLTCLQDGLKELKRVAKSGATVSSLDMGKPKGAFLKAIYHIHFETIIPFLGKTLFHRGEFNSFAYLAHSNKYFPSPQELVELFREQGFTNVKNINYMLGAVAQQIAQVP